MQTAVSNLEMVIEEITNKLNCNSYDQLNTPSYETGRLGYALYFAYLAKYKEDQKLFKQAEAHFDDAMASIDFNNFNLAYDGDSVDAQLAHIGRFILFAQKNELLDIDADDYLAQLDEILFDLMKSKIEHKDFDSLSGAMASGFYFLERFEQKNLCRDQIAHLVIALKENAEEDEEGDYFWKSPSLYDRIYLGISHGSGLMMSFLCHAIESEIEVELATETLKKATKYLKKQYRKTEFKGLFPNMIGDEIEDMQFALCYGDLGTAYALLKASIVLKDKKLRSFTDAILEDCLTRSKNDNLTLDASIYYGASGLVIAFDKIAKITKDDRYSERSEYWFNQILTYKIYNNDYCGFQTRLVEQNDLWNVSCGWGILGIGITLMAYGEKNLPPMDKLTFVA